MIATVFAIDNFNVILYIIEKKENMYVKYGVIYVAILYLIIYSFHIKNVYSILIYLFTWSQPNK